MANRLQLLADNVKAKKHVDSSFDYLDFGSLFPADVNVPFSQTRPSGSSSEKA